MALAGMGYVYELRDNAFSFDGADIRWTLKTAYMHMSSPGTVKSWRHLTVEQGAHTIFNCDVWWNIEYRAGLQFSSDRIESELTEFSATPEAASLGSLEDSLWNVASWNQFYWNASQSTEVSDIPLNGHSTSIGFAFSAKTKHDPNFNISGLFINYIPRRSQRG